MQILRLSKSGITSLAFTPDGQALAAACDDDTLRLWDLAAGRERAAWTVRRMVGRVAVSPDGRFVVWGGLRGRVWDMDRPDEPVLIFPEGRVRQAVFSPDGRVLAATGSRVRRWDAGTWAELPGCGDEPGEGEPVTEGLSGTLAYSPDGRTLAVAYRTFGGRSRIIVRGHDADTGAVRDELTALGTYVNDLAFAPDGRALAGLCGTILRVWDVTTGRELLAQKAGTRTLQGLAFTPDGRWLAVADNGPAVRLWDAATWQERQALAWGIGKLPAVAVAPDGLRMAAGSGKGQVVVWDVDG